MILGVFRLNIKGGIPRVCGLVVRRVVFSNFTGVVLNFSKIGKWLEGGMLTSNMGLTVAKSHPTERHMCVVPDKRSRSENVE